MSQQGWQETSHVLKNFFRQPVQEMAKLPDWGLLHTLTVQAACAASSGLITGLFPPGLWKIMQGLIFFPILITVMTALFGCFFYYYFQIFERRTVSYARLVTLIFFANLPYFLFHVASGLFPPADIIGLGMGAILLVVGLTENFGLEKKRSLRLIGFVFGLLFLLWVGEKISSIARDRDPASVSTPAPTPALGDVG